MCQTFKIHSNFAHQKKRQACPYGVYVCVQRGTKTAADSKGNAQLWRLQGGYGAQQPDKLSGELSMWVTGTPCDSAAL